VLGILIGKLAPITSSLF